MLASQRFTVRYACTFFLISLAATAQVRTLQDGTPVRLRLSRNVSSSTAHVQETVDFEVTEPVIDQNYVVIPKGAVALGRVSKVQAKRRFGRAGALELSIDSVRLTDGQTIPLRATREKGEGDMSGPRVAATIAASPVLVWVKGKDVTFEKAASSHRFHVEVKAAKRPATTGGETPATRVPGFTAMRSEFLIRALAWRPRGPCPARRPAVAVRSVRRVRARKNGCIFSSSARSIPLTVGSIDPRHHLG